MATTISIELGFEFEVIASPKEVFEVLANVPDSASHYPGVEQVVDLGDGVYRWEMEKVGVGAVTLQIVYASHYVANKTKKTVVWTAVEGEGNAQVSGSWTITKKKKSTHLMLLVDADVSLPVPALMKGVVTPLVEAEFDRLTMQYIANLCERFGGEA
jgi:carbon monoxide dehydrogenase subunit G